MNYAQSSGPVQYCLLRVASVKVLWDLIFKFSKIAFWHHVELVFDKFPIEFVGIVVAHGLPDVGGDIDGWDAAEEADSAIFVNDDGRDGHGAECFVESNDLWMFFHGDEACD